ncbi:hypothetical protein QOL99_12145 [Deinococcus sp. MIMF12]|uniref:Uncharacterized protein n=1 Tax=Deinococcus rhizophilus TaxID=3049544 RepID=A0ABT7JIK5_9DEIO|nr:hypothetical protein [Deinococcus rhizophilus]MDL2344896.1 hypothetical protein [Deinococcus rhizophilus]
MPRAPWHPWQLAARFCPRAALGALYFSLSAVAGDGPGGAC